MTMGERITVLRTKHNLSQAELARRAKIGQSTLHAYESGARSAAGMSLDVALRVAQALGISLGYLATGKPRPRRATVAAGGKGDGV